MIKHAFRWLAWWLFGAAHTRMSDPCKRSALGRWFAERKRRKRVAGAEMALRSPLLQRALAESMARPAPSEVDPAVIAASLGFSPDEYTNARWVNGNIVVDKIARAREVKFTVGVGSVTGEEPER